MSGKNWNGERRTSVRPLNPAIAIQANGKSTLTVISAMRTADATRWTRLFFIVTSAVDCLVGADESEDHQRHSAQHHEQQQGCGQREARRVRREVPEAVEDEQVRRHG